MLNQLITTILIIQNTISIPPNRAAKNASSIIGTESMCTETLINLYQNPFTTYGQSWTLQTTVPTKLRETPSPIIGTPCLSSCQQYCSFIDRQETYVFKFLTLFAILSCLVCSSLDIVHITIHFIECSFLQSKWESIIASFADITYFIAKYDTTLRLLHLISKHSILFGIAMITNQCFHIAIILEEHFNENPFTIYGVHYYLYILHFRTFQVIEILLYKHKMIYLVLLMKYLVILMMHLVLLMIHLVLLMIHLVLLMVHLVLVMIHLVLVMIHLIHIQHVFVMVVVLLHHLLHIYKLFTSKPSRQNINEKHIKSGTVVNSFYTAAVHI